MDYETNYIWDMIDPKSACETIAVYLLSRNKLQNILAPNSIDDLTVFIFENRLFDNYQPQIVMLREWGEPISKEVRKSLGIKSRAVLGDKFIGLLSANGKTQAAENARNICHWIWHLNFQYYMRRLVENDGSLVRYRIESTTCCNSALKYQFGVGDIEDFNGFPLDNCNKPICTCNIERYSPQWHGAIENDLRKPRQSIVAQVLKSLFGKK